MSALGQFQVSVNTLTPEGGEPVRSKVLAPALSALALVGCAQYQPPTYVPVPYDEAEYAALPKSGTGVVKGQVFALTVGGDVKKGAGQPVYLMPATSFRNQWYHESIELGHALAVDADRRHLALERKTIADGDGRFEFVAVPPGSYYVMSQITWSVPSKYGLEPQGGLVVLKVDVKNGESTDAMLRR
jgi:hypothetical protein